MRVHFINLPDGREVAYFPDVKRFFLVNEKAKELISDFSRNKDKEYILHKYEITEEEYADYAKRMTSFSNPLCNIQHISPLRCCTSKTERTLDRLVIHLSNDCNLRCVYCYANGGVYSSGCDLLTKQMLDRILDTFYREFHRISTIQFFGGEPLLNVEMLEYACKSIREIDRKRGYETTFGIVVNGTLISQKFINLVKEYKINVTVSYDGNPEVNDKLRVFPNGQGATESILHKAKWLKNETGEPNTIEVTYTQHHVDSGVSILDVVKHITREFPNTYVHLVPAGGDEACDYVVKDLSIFPASVKEICARIIDNPDAPVYSYSLADRIFSALRFKDRQTSRYICDAGFGTLSVTTKGDIYPCFMFTDRPKLKLGNICDAGVFESDDFNSLTSAFYEFSDKFHNAKCKNCFINTLCNGCLGLNSFASGDALLLSDDICTMFRQMTEEAIIGLTLMNDRNNAQ